MPAEGGQCGPDGVPAVYIGRGAAVFEYDLPVAVEKVQLDQLLLSLRSEGGWGEEPATALYAWAAQEWVEVEEPEFGENPIAEADLYVSADGVVRVRLTVPNASQGACYVVAVGFEGVIGAE
jgi:hypothetical protein